MKTRIGLLFGLLLLISSFAYSKETTMGNNPSQQNAINVFTSPELYNLTMKWAAEYGRLDPATKFNVVKALDNKVTGFIKADSGIGFVSDESMSSIINPAWSMVVGHDVIVPVMNSSNPIRDEIYHKGITSQGLNRLLETPSKSSWGILTGNDKNTSPVHYYIMNDPSVFSGVENFIKSNRLNSVENKPATAQEMIASIQKDPNALGFCKLVQIMDLKTQNLAENILIIPIDKNGNGKIDYMENIYDNLQDFARGVWIGKYPKALSGNVYLVSAEKPKSVAELAFLNWVLTDGQQFLTSNGYNDLVLNERKTQLDKINEPAVDAVAQVNETSAILKMILIVLFVFIAIGFIYDMITRRFSKKGLLAKVTSVNTGVFDENSLEIPKGIYFDKTHTWAFMKKDGMVKIGVDDFLLHVTGPITRIEMKKPGEKIKKGERLLTIIQKGKQLDIYSPISGKIKSQNESLASNSSPLNNAPFEEGWIYTIEPTNWSLEIQFLTMADQYKVWLKEEFSRLKDFFATELKVNVPEYALVTLQDGGALRDSLLAELGPEIWDDFQTKFIDISR